MSEQTHRRVVAFCAVSIDGFSSGRAGPAHDTWLHENALTPQSEAYFESVWRGATTVVMGRTNAEGFGAVWPGMAVSADLSERSRAYGRFLVNVEKVGVSRTLAADGLDHFDWVNARVTDDLEGEVRSLREQEGGDILIQNSASIIRQLLRVDLVDDLRLVIVPVLLAEGLRLLDELHGIDETSWQLQESSTFANGAVGVHYARARQSRP